MPSLTSGRLAQAGDLAACRPDGISVLRIAAWAQERGFGLVGYSLLAARAHMAARFFTAYRKFPPPDCFAFYSF